MTITIKKKYVTKNKTKKNQNKMVVCPIGLKPFESNFKNSPSLSGIKSISKRQKQFVKALKAKFSPNSIQPNNDYYDYINYQWLKNISLEQQQKYIVQIDDFRLAQDNVYKQLHNIILEYIKTHNDKLSKNLKNYYDSVIEMNPLSYSKQLAKEAVQMVEDIIHEDNPWKMIAFMNSDEMISFRAPFVWSINPDDKNVKINRCYLDPHQFTLIDMNVYYNDGTDVKYKDKYRKRYAGYCKKLFDTILGPNDYGANDVFDVEVELLGALDCVNITNKEEKMYNKVTKDESLSKYGFDWAEFTKQLGFKKTPDFFITSSLNYLKCCSDLLIKNWKTPKWKTYWVWILIKRLARITKNWEDLTYEFHGKFERGQESINISNAVGSALYMSVPFNNFLTNQYVAQYENPQAIEFVKILCDDLKIVFERIIKNNTWLQPATKKYALKKLKYFKFIYGTPEKIPEDPDLHYTDILYDNIEKVMVWRHQKMIELEGKSPVDMPMMDWSDYPVKMVGSQAYIVNASYTPSKNAIYINLGYIQKPFVDLDERGIEYNLAHIGYTIGHEMGHSLDDLGSQYGYDGNLYDWWSAEDRRKYNLIQKDIINQYEVFAARDGIKFDASIGIGEDMADIAGMNICDEFLRDFQDKNQDLIPIRNLSYEAYYVFFAFQQKQMVKKKALSAQLKTNPHPLDKYRCNIPLSRSQIFRSIYNVKKGDGMWWHNTNTIW
jgi:putative endopeptidase